MSHSQSRVWALSQTANKESGTCSVCLSTRQLHLKDGTVHQHGPRGNRCPGSDKLPRHVSDDRAATLASRSATCSDTASVPAPTSADSSSRCFQPSLSLPSTSGQQIRGFPSASSTTPLSSHSVHSHPVLGVPTIKHIPKPARAACASNLEGILKKIASNPSEPSSWHLLLSFAQNILRAPKRGGRKRNLATAIIMRTNSSSVDDEKSVRTASSSAKRDAVSS